MTISIEDRIQLLEEFKTKDWYILDAWEDRDLQYPGDDVVGEMKLELIDFTNFLIFHLKKVGINLQVETQKYYNNWDTEYFENDEIEFIVETAQLAMKIAGIDTDEIII